VWLSGCAMRTGSARSFLPSRSATRAITSAAMPNDSHEEAPGLRDRGAHRIRVERRNRPQIDHLGVDPVLRELRRDAQREGHHHPCPDERDVGAGPANGGAAEPDPIRRFGYRALEGEQ
jgi:hypothetical protein